MLPPPEATLTFFLTDIEGSTRLWEQQPAQMPKAVARHDVVLSACIATHHGRVIRHRGEGDSLFAVFASASDAVTAADACQRALAAEPWPFQPPIRVRIAILTGEAHLQDGDYRGTDINHCARLRGLATGGQVLLGETAAFLVRDVLPPGAALRDLGQHRLRDLRRPERVFQLDCAGLQSEFPPLASLDALPNNLPQELTPFIGREKEIAEVSDLLREARLVTITGAGGSGKTRLGLQVAAHSVAEFPDGVWLVELGAVSQPERFHQTVALALRVGSDALRTADEAVLQHLQARRLLLVLDNCEHLIDTCARAVREWLRASPSVKVLATSREALGIPGELPWRIPPLRVPDAGSLPRMRRDLPAVLGEYEGVSLFVERARTGTPGFALTLRNAPAIVQICHLLDGMPLAIELAAAKTRVLHVDQIAERLKDRFRLLTGGDRTSLPRHQTLRALIDWSYDLLSEPEQRLLRRLSVFAEGWSLEAAEAVCADECLQEDRILDLLTLLVDRSLVVSEVTDQAPSHYRLLQTVREYGRDRLMAAGEAPGAWSRFVHYHRTRATEAEDGLRGPQQPVWLDTLDREHNDFRAALEWSLQTRGGGDDALAIAVALFQFWYVRGYLSEACDWVEAALRCDPPASPVLRARAWNALGLLRCARGDHTNARTAIEEALAFWRKVADRQGIATGNSSLGMVAAVSGDYQTARDAYVSSLNAYADLGDHVRARRVSCNLAVVLLDAGDLAGARERLDAELAPQRPAQDPWSTGVLLHARCRLIYLEGDWISIVDALSRCLEHWMSLNDQHYVVNTLGMIAAAAAQHDAGVAARLFGSVESLRTACCIVPSQAEQKTETLGIAQIRAALTGEELARLWAGGQGRSLHDLVEEARDCLAAMARDPGSLPNSKQSVGE